MSKRKLEEAEIIQAMQSEVPDVRYVYTPCVEIR
jgi:hypothetical protein